MIEVGGAETGVLEAPARGGRRKAGAVLDPVEALLLGGGDELTVDDERFQVSFRGVCGYAASFDYAGG